MRCLPAIALATLTAAPPGLCGTPADTAAGLGRLGETVRLVDGGWWLFASERGAFTLLREHPEGRLCAVLFGTGGPVEGDET